MRRFRIGYDIDFGMAMVVLMLCSALIGLLIGALLMA